MINLPYSVLFFHNDMVHKSLHAKQQFIGLSNLLFLWDLEFIELLVENLYRVVIRLSLCILPPLDLAPCAKWSRLWLHIARCGGLWRCWRQCCDIMASRRRSETEGTICVEVQNHGGSGCMFVAHDHIHSVIEILRQKYLQLKSNDENRDTFFDFEFGGARMCFCSCSARSHHGPHPLTLLICMKA